jgi:hypothetical protein
VNGDGIDDLIVGAATSETTAASTPGEAYVDLSARAGNTRGTVDLANLDRQRRLCIIQGDASGDQAGMERFRRQAT